MGGGTAAIFQLLLVEAIDYAEREVPLGIIFVLIKAEVVDASSLIVIECVEKVGGGKFDFELVSEEALVEACADRPVGIESIDALISTAVIVKVEVNRDADRQL